MSNADKNFKLYLMELKRLFKLYLMELKLVKIMVKQTGIHFKLYLMELKHPIHLKESWRKVL